MSAFIMYDAAAGKDTDSMSTFEPEKVCSICHKPVAGLKARTDVTRFLGNESRCQCIIPGVQEYQREVQAEEARLNASVLEKQGLQLKFIEQDANRRRLKMAESPAALSPVEIMQGYLPDKYKILEVVGEGGMGVVVKATTSEGTVVAVKIMRPQLVEDVEARTRFEREAQLAIQLQHANIARVVDYGVGKLNALFIVMDYIEGESLESILAREGTIKPKRALDLFLQVAQALAYAHEQKILHRDIKPANLLIESYAGIETVKIVDFGIARMIHSPADQTQGLTRTGELIGSPDYMSPEQIMGRPLDERSDIYSLGCVMYKTLCGVTPFEADNPVRVMLRHVEEMPMPVSAKVKGPVVSADLNYIVMRCIDSNVRARYDAQELADDIATRRSGQKLRRDTDAYALTRVTPTFDGDGSLPVVFKTESFTKDGYVPVKPPDLSGEFDVLWLCFITLIAGAETGFILLSYLIGR